MKPSEDEVNANYFSHKEALKSVKPMVSTFRKDLGPSKNNKKEIQNYNEKDLVYKMFSSVPKQKSTLDNRLNSTYLKRASKIDRNKPQKNKYDKFLDHQHQMELKSMKQRIGNCGSLLQRQKRTYDPITHPTYFMRRPEEGRQRVSIQPFAQSVLNKNSLNTILQRPNSAHPKSGQIPSHLYTSKTCYKDHNSVTLLPPQPQFPGNDFKSIVDYIVDNRVYKEVELRVLYERLSLRYGEEAVDPIWQRAMSEMEKQI